MAIVKKTKDQTLYHVPPYQNLVRMRSTAVGYVQKPLIDKSLPLQYSKSLRVVVNQKQIIGYDPPFDAFSTRSHMVATSKFDPSSEESKLATSRAWSKLQQALQWVGGVEGGTKQLSRASLGVTLAEGREAMGMIATRAKGLGKAFRSLKRGNFKAFLKALDARPLPHHKKTRWTKPKDAASLWLEYWLGWAPAVGDIYNCIDVLQSDFGAFAEPLTIKGRGKSKFSIKQSGSNNWGGYTAEGSGFVAVEMGCQVTIENPNLLLANQLGLVNPASVAWAVVPFSFVVGWFMNLQQVLDSYTDFVGLKVTRQYTTRFMSFDGSESRWTTWSGQTIRKSSVETFGHDMARELNLTRPRLRAWVPAGLSPTRGATAISLLVSIFTKG